MYALEMVPVQFSLILFCLSVSERFKRRKKKNRTLSADAEIKNPRSDNPREEI